MSWGKMLTVAAVCFLKLILGGIPTAAGLNLTFMETFLAASIGGLAGITCFVFLIERIMILWQGFFPPKANKKVFSLKRRLIVKAKQRFGLTGIAFLTPFVLSMPLGAFIALRFYPNRRKVLRYMYTSVILWSLFGAWLAGPIKDLKDWIINLL